MKKLLLGILLLTLLVTVSLPIIVGHIVQNKYISMIDFLNEKIKLNAAKINIIMYQRGYLSARAKAIISLPNSDGAVTKITCLSKIKHGPFVKAKGVRKLAIVNSNYGIDNTSHKINSITAIDFNKGWSFNLIAPKNKYNALQKAIIWQDLNIAIAYDHKLHKVNSYIDIPQFAIKFASDAFLLENFKYNGNIKINELGFNGDAGFALQQMLIKKYDKIIQFNDGQLAFNIIDNATKINLNYKGNFKSLKTSYGKYGPLNYNISIDNLVLPALPKLYAIIMNKEDNFKGKWHADIIKALSHNPMLTIKDTNIVTPSGNFAIDSHVAINDKITKYTVNKVKIADFLESKIFIKTSHDFVEKFLLKNLKNNLNLERIKYSFTHEGERMPLPSSLLHENEQTELSKRLKRKIAKLIKEDLLVKIDDYYKININYENSALSINNKEVTVPEKYKTW